MLTVVGFLLSITAIAIYISSRVRLDIREIRITESIGWRDRDVRNLYLWQSSITGFTGGLFGLLLAILFYRLITGGLYLFSGFGWAILLAGLVLPWLASFITSFTAVKRSMR
jgi:ABC-type antimicrobial peptide transport system permease subunit